MKEHGSSRFEMYNEKKALTKSMNILKKRDGKEVEQKKVEENDEWKFSEVNEEVNVVENNNDEDEMKVSEVPFYHPEIEKNKKIYTESI